jgi:uncharacterized protein (UPF0276 family)
MDLRFPPLPGRGLGVGLDLPWDGLRGFGCQASGRDGLAAALRTFLRAHASRWSHAFFSWQPRDRAPARLADYRAAWDDLAQALPPNLPRGLHHTALNLGGLQAQDRSALLAFTTALCQRYRLGWVNEDVGLWSLAGRPLPYPLPPVLTGDGLRANIQTVRDCQAGLEVPLVLEFPGFSRGVSLVLGDWDAYDFFRVLAQQTASPVALDVAHLLSWRWWRGHRGADLYQELHRLPLEHCFEIHMSGCEIVADRFIDAHHGRLLDQQLVLLSRLLPLCPNLRAVTFEDPRFDDQGQLEPASRRSWQQLEEVTGTWMPSARRN